MINLHRLHYHNDVVKKFCYILLYHHITAVFSTALKLTELKIIYVLLHNYHHGNRSINASETSDIYSIKLECIQDVSKYLNVCLFSYLLIIWQNIQKKTFIKLSEDLVVSLIKKEILIIMLIIKNEELIHNV